MSGAVSPAMARARDGGAPQVQIGTVGIVGSGAMGRGIAESCLRAGLRVVLNDTSPAALTAAVQHIRAGLHRAVHRQQNGANVAESWLARLDTTADLAELGGCDLVVEAVPEVLAIKSSVLAGLAERLPAGTIMVSNTSSIPITKLAAAVADPSRFLGLHFFNPVPRMDLVEVIPTILTDPETTRAVELFVREQLQKTPLTIPDRPGFAVNALLIPYLLSAARMLDSGYASAESIDQGMTLGCGHPIGPLELSDFIGLDVVCHVADSIHAETKDPACVVPNNLRRLVEAGHLVRKTGRGFYSHPAKTA